MTAGFEDVVETDDVAFDIDIGVLDAVADTSLGSEVDNDVELVFCKEIIDKLAVGNAAFDELIVYR